jgi:hypothetical protein
MPTIVFCLEEPSAWAMLEAVLPKLVPPTVTVRKIIFEGKSDLDKRLARRVRGWQAPDTRFLVLRDQDSADCAVVKAQLSAKLADAGRPDSVVRIACHELEAFYLGDLAAVENGLELKNVAKRQPKVPFRKPDTIANAAQELESITNCKYQKISGSRAIGPHLALDGSNASRSFNVLIDAIRMLGETSE